MGADSMSELTPPPKHGEGEALAEYRLCYVRWRDSQQFPGWHNATRLVAVIEEPVMIAQSVGWLMAETETHLLLAQSVCEYVVGDLLKIPRDCVAEMYILNKPEDESGS